MFLYHFTSAKFDTLKPSFFGVNHYSRNEAQASGVKRAFLYPSRFPLEHTLTGTKYRYSFKVNAKDFYNLDIDGQGLKEKFNFDIDKILTYLKREFLGVSYNFSFPCYIVFSPLKVYKVKELNGVTI